MEARRLGLPLWMRGWWRTNLRLRETGRWVDEGLVEPFQAERILNRYGTSLNDAGPSALGLLTGLAGKQSVVVVEHDMGFVRSIARKVTVLHQGSVLAEGSMDQVSNDPEVIKVYLGEEA